MLKRVLRQYDGNDNVDRLFFRDVFNKIKEVEDGFSQEELSHIDQISKLSNLAKHDPNTEIKPADALSCVSLLLEVAKSFVEIIKQLKQKEDNQNIDNIDSGAGDVDVNPRAPGGLW